MTGPARPARLARLVAALLVLVVMAPAAQAMTEAQRRALDLSGYRVVDRDAAFLDVAARTELLATTGNPMLADGALRLAARTGCAAATRIPVIDFPLRVPAFYPDPARWREIAVVLFAFEEAATDLAGAFVASGDAYFADCLVDLLDRWARRDALVDFHYADDAPQAWYSTESMIFAAALSYSAVRQAAAVDPAAAARIEDWLVRLARTHSAIRHPGNACCNNHLYRRALYAGIVGIVAGDDALFRFAVGAVYSAISELTPRGAFRREMLRGDRAAHYQNYALLYLVPLMHLIERQGYPIFDLAIDGRTMADAVAFNMAVIADTAALDGLAPRQQWPGYLADPQYFAWMEVWLHHVDDPGVAAFVRPYRPIFNRSMMGHVTLLLMDPAAQRQPEPARDALPLRTADLPPD
jgi:poly(beta-D-mannuronate) lyase